MGTSHDRRRRTALACLMLGALSVAIGRTVSGHSASSPPLPIAGALPGFTLIDQYGRSFSQAALAGRVWVANFIFTSCAGQCPIMTEQFRSLQRMFADEDALTFVSFSVDPARDTPELLTAYAKQYGADPRWHLLTGERDALWALCREGFGLAVERTPASAAEPLTHSVRFVLVDRAGRLRGTYPATDAQAMVRLRRDVRQLLEEEA